MSKKFLIPVFAFAVAAIGCGGNSSDMTGGGAGHTGAAGAATGADGATAGTSALAYLDAGADGAAYVPVCNMDTFCSIYLAFCGTTTPGYTTLAECMTTFAAVGAASPYQQQCETYHLCIAIFDTGSDRTLHCSHAAGGGNVCGF